MPDIPATWRNEQNIGGFLDLGVRIAQLANGNLLLVWWNEESIVWPLFPPPPLGIYNIRARLYDPAGTPLGGTFQLVPATASQKKSHPEIAALPDGGFVCVYEDSASPGLRVGIREFNATGASAHLETIGPGLRPQVAVSGAGSVLITYEATVNGNMSIVGRLYDATSNGLGSAFLLIEGAIGADVAVLSNGNYVIAADKSVAGDQAIAFRIVDPAGADVVGTTYVAGTQTDSLGAVGASVTGLAGGGFVIAWIGGGSEAVIDYRVYDSSGSQTFAGMVDYGIPYHETGQADVSALPDGGFIIAYANNVAIEGNVFLGLTAEHFAASGAALGRNNFASAGWDLSAISLADGRFAVVWTDVGGGGFGFEILDTRDAVNSPGVYFPDQHQVGTIFDDTFVMSPGAEVAHGWVGNDVIRGSDGMNLIFGDAGNDLLDGGYGADRLEGGDGNDAFIVDTGDTVIERAGGGSDRVYASTSFALGPGSHVEMITTTDNLGTAPVNLVGNELAQYIFGNAGANAFDGGGGGGADVLLGFEGDDIYFVRSTDRVVEGPGAGFDRLLASASFTLEFGSEVEMLTTNDNLRTASIDITGNGLSQYLFGNEGGNVLNGFGGNDVLIGFGGADTFAFTRLPGPVNVARINDFQAGLDKVALDDFVFTGLSPGSLPAGAFRTGTDSLDADDRIVYDPASGALYFDADGLGGAAAVHFATLAPGLALSAGDFAVI